MKSFKVNETGDVSITNNSIDMVCDKDYIYQKIKAVLSTNINEWQLNRREGIDFRNIIGKNIDKDIVRSEIIKGLKQVDKNFILQDFKIEVDKNRKAKIKFTAILDNAEYKIEQIY